jgi:hypothetical protein
MKILGVNVLSKLNTASNAVLTETKNSSSKKIDSKIVYNSLNRFNKDLADWKVAVEEFEDESHSNREDLNEIHENIVIDAHLTALIEQRKNKTLSKDFKVVNEAGEEDEEATRLIEKPWLRDVISLALDSIFYGHSLIQFGDRIGVNFESITVVNRGYVDPYKKVVRPYPSALDGTSYIEPPYSGWVLEAGKFNDFGLLTKCAPLVINKKASMGCWAEYAELFGSPMRIGKTNVRDKALLENMYTMLANMGSAAFGVFNTDDTIELIENSKTDAFNVFDKMIERSNSELSKLILGSTMTTDNGSSRSQADVHERTSEAFFMSDAAFIDFWVNDKLFPFLINNHGFALDGLKFKFDDKETSTLSERFDRDIKLLQYYDIEDQFIEKTYGTPVTKKITPLPLGGAGTGKQVTKAENLAAIIDLYSNIQPCNNIECTIHGVENAKNPEILTPSEREALFEGVFFGVINPYNLPENLYFNTAEYLHGAILKTFGKTEETVLELIGEDLLLYEALRDNAFIFSAAKTFNEVLIMSDSIITSEGTILSFADFKKKAGEVFDTFNVNYLRAEYEQALSGSQMAVKWNELQANKDAFPNLQYITQGDLRVGEDHKPLDGIIQPIDSKFWARYYPPNRFGCRCNVLNLTDNTDGIETDLTKITLPKIPKDFQFNVGKDKVLYSPEHPYFIIDAQFKGIARENFNLPLPPKIEQNGNV